MTDPGQSDTRRLVCERCGSGDVSSISGLCPTCEQAGQSDIARLAVGVSLWDTGSAYGRDELVRTERTEADEVAIFVATGPTLYFSRAAAREIGQQLVDRADGRFKVR
jgi:hypothetical protein